MLTFVYSGERVMHCHIPLLSLSPSPPPAPGHCSVCLMAVQEVLTLWPLTSVSRVLNKQLIGRVSCLAWWERSTISVCLQSSASLFLIVALSVLFVKEQCPLCNCAPNIRDGQEGSEDRMLMSSLVSFPPPSWKSTSNVFSGRVQWALFCNPYLFVIYLCFSRTK